MKLNKLMEEVIKKKQGIKTNDKLPKFYFFTELGEEKNYEEANSLYIKVCSEMRLDSMSNLLYTPSLMNLLLNNVSN
jgi:hypothetical protein